MLIMLCIHWTTIILFCAQASHIFCLTPTNMEIRESYLILNSDGTLKYTSKVPDCGSGGKIFLVSYSYHQIQCDNDCYPVHEEPLLPNDIMLLHEMCSMKEKCQNLTFGVRTEEQRNRINSVKITFRCLDHASTLIDICAPCTVFFNNTLYLTTSSDTARLFRMCECFVNRDTFSIQAEDIRLNSIQEKKCTDTVVQINSKEFKCDPERGSFDAVFKRTVAVSISNAFLSVIPNSATELPSMVLITVSPKRTSRITCIPKPSRSGAVTLSFARTPKPAVTVEEVTYTNSISHKDTERSLSSTDCGLLFLYAILVSLVCVIATTCFVTINIIRRRSESKEYNKTKEKEMETDEVQTPVIFKCVSYYSEEGSKYNLNEQDQIAGFNGKCILPSDPIMKMPFANSINYSSHSFQKSDIQHTPISTCDTTFDTDMCGSVSKTTLNKVPSDEEVTEKESFYDTDVGEDTPIYMFKPLLSDERDNDFSG